MARLVFDAEISLGPVERLVWAFASAKLRRLTAYRFVFLCTSLMLVHLQSER